MAPRIKRLIIVVLLLIASIMLSRYASQRAVFEKHKEAIPLDSQLKELVKKNPEYQSVIDTVQDFYWNAWLSKAALKNGGWKNILALCTKDFSKKISESQQIQDAIAIGSIHKNVQRIYLDKERSKIISVEEDKKRKGYLTVLVDVWLGVDQKGTGDYFLHQQAAIEMKKEKVKWLISNFFLFSAEEKPADIIPE